MQPARLTALCADPRVGLERSVRLRALAVTPNTVPQVLDTIDPDDERWPDIFSKAGFLLSTAAGMRAIQIITSHWSPEQIKSRLAQRLGHRGAA